MTIWIIKTLLFFAAISAINSSFSSILKENLSYEVLNGDSDRDPYDSLSYNDLEEWTEETESNLLNKIEKLKQNFEEIILIEIVLIGFPSSSSNHSWSLSKKELDYYLSQVHYDNKIGILRPSKREEEWNGEHELFIKRKFLFQVSEGSKPLSNKISSLIEGYIKQREAKIPHRLLDQIIQSEYEKQKDGSLRVYLIHPQISTLGFHSYYYESKGGLESCGTSLGMGEGLGQRYLWLDVTSRSHQYGPTDLGEGVVSPFLGVPNVQRVISLHKSGKMTANDFVVDVVSFIKRTCEYFVSPSISHYPLPGVGKEVLFHLFILSDYSALGGSGFNWKIIQDKMDTLGEEFKFQYKETHIPLKDSYFADLILKYSTKTTTHSGREEFYLDSEELSHWIRNFWKKFESYQPEETFFNTIPIFLFDLSSDKFGLIDQSYQSVSFPDMVVAFQSLHSDFNTEYSCDGNDIRVDISDATRSVFASMLETTFGITPSHLKWNSVLKRPSQDFLWSIGHSPGAIFSNSTGLSFNVADNVVKNTLYSRIQDSLSLLNAVLFHYVNSKLTMSQVLTEDEYDIFLRRWNMLQFKADEVKNHLSHFEYQQASKFIQSMFFDVTALHEVVHDAGERMEVSFVCKNQTPNDSDWLRVIKWALIVSPVFVGGWVAASTLRMKRGSKKRRD
eukprot:TRINITY_DN1890_c1_g1_i1.p1 TRINITY_DN1890_c1_g1~~TRINITY_DN1890_c1_g1_i1.p1  ORF type:complete len:674 (+),score=232.56 TRINITY_DN1890_c1_g1_i1:360-2381(+)